MGCAEEEGFVKPQNPLSPGWPRSRGGEVDVSQQPVEEPCFKACSRESGLGKAKGNQGNVCADIHRNRYTQIYTGTHTKTVPHTHRFSRMHICLHVPVHTSSHTDLVSQSHTHTHTLSHAHTQANTRSHTPTHTPSHTHSLTHTQTLSHCWAGARSPAGL